MTANTRLATLSHVSRRHFLATGLGSFALLLHSRFAFGDDVPTPKFLLEWGEHGEKEGEFSACVGLAIGPDDVIYTGEFRNERIQKFSTDGKFLGMFKVQPHVGGIAVDAEGTVFVGHWNSNKVAAYSSAGELLREWGTKGSGDGEFLLPGSVAVGPDNLIYVPDQGNSRVQKFTKEGKYVGQFGSLGFEPGQFGGDQSPGGRFAGPQFVAFDSHSNIYTTDAALDRVTKFTPEGKFLGMWGSESSEPGGFGPPPLNKDGTPSFGGPIALCLDKQDRVWVSATNSRVQLFTNDGKYLCGMGGEGADPGQFYRPHGMAIDSTGNLYVADTMNDRVQKFAVE
ncbi:MAG: hypothetical protein O2955_06695 [Planctomycetota bacterium]|nr:hypothetical protein [Planctomycetota bacterium]MDA1212183.1 hypothetical protein [Planctomycetota bacterium]